MILLFDNALKISGEPTKIQSYSLSGLNSVLNISGLATIQFGIPPNYSSLAFKQPKTLETSILPGLKTFTFLIKLC